MLPTLPAPEPWVSKDHLVISINTGCLECYYDTELWQLDGSGAPVQLLGQLRLSKSPAAAVRVEGNTLALLDEVGTLVVLQISQLASSSRLLQGSAASQPWLQPCSESRGRLIYSAQPHSPAPGSPGAGGAPRTPGGDGARDSDGSGNAPGAGGSSSSSDVAVVAAACGAAAVVVAAVAAALLCRRRDRRVVGSSGSQAVKAMVLQLSREMGAQGKAGAKAEQELWIEPRCVAAGQELGSGSFGRVVEVR